MNIGTRLEHRSVESRGSIVRWGGRHLEAIKIVLMTIGGSIVYGICHDQVTARIYLPYFTVYHPEIVPSQDPTLVAAVWGVVATWWVGLILGIALAVCSQYGDAIRFPSRRLWKPLGIVLLCTGLIAASSGIFSYASGYALDNFRMNGMVVAGGYAQLRMFTAVFVTHNASYLAGFLGGLSLCVWILNRRRALSRGEL